MLCPLQGYTLVKKPVTGLVVLNVYKQKTPRRWGLMWLIIIYRWII